MIAPTVRPIQFEDFNGTKSERLEFRFNAIPVHLVSSIYQQLARTSGADKARSQGLRDTRVELVHLTLALVFERLSPNATVVDPACGSGGLLIEAFSGLVWRVTNGKFARRELVGLYSQLWASTSTAELLASPCSAFSWQLSSSTSSRSATSATSSSTRLTR
ncbi:SAM-dependent methyltransferase [Mesorhizobium sp. M0029]